MLLLFLIITVSEEVIDFGEFEDLNELLAEQDDEDEDDEVVEELELSEVAYNDVDDGEIMFKLPFID